MGNGIKLPGGFSPLSAVKQVGSYANPTGGVADYDVLSDRTYIGGERSPSVNTFGNAAAAFRGFAAPQQTTQTAQNDEGGNTLGLFTGGGSGGGAGGAAGPDYSGEIAGLTASEGRLRSLLGVADTKLNQGLTQLEDSYQGERGKANLGRTRALEDYGYQREDAENRRESALNKVDTNARVLNDGLRRKLGLASGSGSSAFQYAAPNAVAREATRQRQGVFSDLAGDFRNLDTAENRAKIDFDDLLQSLLNQRRERESQLREGILSNKQEINTRLGDAASQRVALSGGGTGAQVAAARPFADNYDSYQGEINSLFDRYRPSVTSREVTPDRVDLSEYETDRAEVNANREGGADAYSPYAQLLKKRQQTSV